VDQTKATNGVYSLSHLRTGTRSASTIEVRLVQLPLPLLAAEAMPHIVNQQGSVTHHVNGQNLEPLPTQKKFLEMSEGDSDDAKLLDDEVDQLSASLGQAALGHQGAQGSLQHSEELTQFASGEEVVNWLLAKERSKTQRSCIYHYAIAACARLGDTEALGRCAQRMSAKGVAPHRTTSNNAIAACAKARDVAGAESWMQWMVKMRQYPNRTTYANVINACARANNLPKVAEWLVLMVEAGFAPPKGLSRSILHAVLEPQQDEEGGQRSRPQIGLVGVQENLVAKAEFGESWLLWLMRLGIPLDSAGNLLVRAFTQAGSHDKVLVWVKNMLEKDIALDQVTIDVLLEAPLQTSMATGQQSASWLRMLREVRDYTIGSLGKGTHGRQHRRAAGEQVCGGHGKSCQTSSLQGASSSPLDLAATFGTPGLNVALGSAVCGTGGRLPNGRPPLGESRNNGSYGGDGRSGPVDAATSSLRLWVFSGEAGRVVGRGGETLRAIEEASGAQVKVQRRDASGGSSGALSVSGVHCGSGSERLIQVSGSPSQVASAREMIERVVTYCRGEGDSLPLEKARSAAPAKVALLQQTPLSTPEWRDDRTYFPGTPQPTSCILQVSRADSPEAFSVPSCALQSGFSMPKFWVIETV